MALRMVLFLSNNWSNSAAEVMMLLMATSSIFPVDSFLYRAINGTVAPSLLNFKMLLIADNDSPVLDEINSLFCMGCNEGFILSMAYLWCPVLHCARH